MIFAHTLVQVLRRQKTETRRLWQPHWELIVNDDGSKWITGRNRAGKLHVYWHTGQTRSVQSGRGEAGEERVRILDLRKEKLQAITEASAKAEGACIQLRAGANGSFSYTNGLLNLWDQIHTRQGTRADDNPDVLVITFELIEKGKAA